MKYFLSYIKKCQTGTYFFGWVCIWVETLNDVQLAPKRANLLIFYSLKNTHLKGKIQIETALYVQFA